jgi:hypothetical protein
MTPQQQKNVYNFVWFTSEENPRLHHQRDLSVLIQLLPKLNSVGYEFKDTILNYPLKSVKKEESKIIFTAEDLIVVTTRPPLTDESKKEKDESRKDKCEADNKKKERTIYRTGHYLEDYFLSVVGKYCFRVSSRSHMKLHSEMARSLKAGYGDRADIVFKTNRSAKNQSSDYRILTDYINNAKPQQFNKNISAAFIIFLKGGNNMPSMLNIFAIGGQEALIFSLMLRYYLWDELQIDLSANSRFIMVEFNTDIPVTNMECLSELKEVPYTILLDNLLPI